MSQPTASEPEASSNLSKSFADRLTFPSDSKSESTPAKFNWADEVTTPVDEVKKQPLQTEAKSDVSKAQTDEAADSSTLSMSQTDGANVWIGGSSLAEPEFDVNVKLADLQADPNNPLFSVKDFNQLNL
jgi:ATP-dependent RNA helicase DDX19/DBP5